MKILSVVGARPNFMKIAPFSRAIKDYQETHPGELSHLLVHTGQHYDDAMSASFFESLGIPTADINLGIGSGTHSEQVGNTMIEFEKVLLSEKPDWVVVVGDVNATAACSMAAKKLGVRVAHIEAGLRSHDMDMPEEINRLVCDTLSDLLLTPDRFSSENLSSCVRAEQKIVFAGNIMIDTLEANKEKALALDSKALIEQALYADSQKEKAARIDIDSDDFGIVTMHRPSNVDDASILGGIVDLLVEKVSEKLPLFWTLHPRTASKLEDFGLLEKLVVAKNIVLLKPLGYHELLKLNALSSLMLTDSGGLQEECAVLGTPCLTMRWNTERPITLQEHGGPSLLVGNDPEKIYAAFEQVLAQAERKPLRPELWDGQSAHRMLEAIINY